MGENIEIDHWQSWLQHHTKKFLLLANFFFNSTEKKKRAFEMIKSVPTILWHLPDKNRWGKDIINEQLQLYASKSLSLHLSGDKDVCMLIKGFCYIMLETLNTVISRRIVIFVAYS